MPSTSKTAITRHLIKEGDARDLSFIDSCSVHLVCTSPPYGALKVYPNHPSQLGNIASYEEFLNELDPVWSASAFSSQAAALPA
jgi:site-specific DNA-methyltransferase (adenine-specific)